MNCQVPCQTGWYDQEIEIDSPSSFAPFFRAHGLGIVPIDQHSVVVLIQYDVPHAGVAMQYLRKAVGEPVYLDNVKTGVGVRRSAGAPLTVHDLACNGEEVVIVLRTRSPRLSSSRR